MIVDFPIEADGESAIGRMHRLMALRREIDDCEPAVGKTVACFLIQPDALIVRPTMGNRSRHALQYRLIDLASRENAGDAAHQRSLARRPMAVASIPNLRRMKITIATFQLITPSAEAMAAPVDPYAGISSRLATRLTSNPPARI